MWWTRLRSSVLFSTIFGILVMSDGGGEELRASGSARDDIPMCAVAADWVSRSHTKALPSSLAELSMLPPAFQRAVMRELPLEVQRDVWLGRIDGLMQSRLLDKASSSMLRELRSRVGAVFDSSLDEQSRVSGARMVWDDAVSSLGRPLAIVALANLSAPSYGALVAEPRLQFRATARMARSTSYSIVSLAPCECNTGYQDCGAAECEWTSNPHCTMTEQGCGPLWLATCDGTCSS